MQQSVPIVGYAATAACDFYSPDAVISIIRHKDALVWVSPGLWFCIAHPSVLSPGFFLLALPQRDAMRQVEARLPDKSVREAWRARRAGQGCDADGA
jgi:hypothetical protein